MTDWEAIVPEAHVEINSKLNFVHLELIIYKHISMKMEAKTFKHNHCLCDNIGQSSPPFKNFFDEMGKESNSLAT